MGKLFSGGGLTAPNTALQDPSGRTTFMGNPNQVLAEANKQLQQSQTGTSVPELQGMLGSAPTKPLPTIGQPSFREASSAGAMPGSANAMSPGLNKAGKLVTLLMGGLQGAMAGRAASEQAVVQSGGRRSGGAGMGFEAGYMLPWQRAMREQEMERGQAQTELLKAESQNVNIPGQGPIPAWLARTMGPAWIRAQSQRDVQQQKSETAENIAGINKRYQVVPNVGLFDTQSRQLVPQTEQGITITPEIAKDHNLPNEFIGKPMSLQQLAAVQRSDVFQTVPVQGAAGPALVNRKTAQVTPLGLGSPGVAAAQARPVQAVVDPNNPGNVTYMTAGQAMKTGAQSPQGAPTHAARTVLQSAVGGKIGDEINAFNTALQHADLLQGALTALSNGDVKALNSLKNRFKTAFGSADVTNFQTISNAYAREITKMLAAGHMTDSEIASSGGTLPANASPKQILGALQAYRALAASKLSFRQQQVQRGAQAQPNFPKNAPAAEKGGFQPF